MDRESLIIETQAAFRGVEKPELNDIAPHKCLECDELRNDLHPYEFLNIPPTVLDKHRWDLPLLSDDAKRYYLPAWILRSINDPQSDYTQALLFALKSDHRWFPTAPYTDRQWRLIARYLEFLEPMVDEFTLRDVVMAKAGLKDEP
jgi:hypothetical protein